MEYHYVYRITNIEEVPHFYYYGTRTSKEVLPKEDIGIKYFSTSLDKEFIKDQKVNPQNYKYKVIKIFNTRKEALELEIYLHKRFDVKLHEQFYNRSNQTSTKFDTTGRSLESFIGKEAYKNVKLKIGKANSGPSVNWNPKCGDFFKYSNPMYNKESLQKLKDSWTPEKKLKQSITQKKRYDTVEKRKCHSKLVKDSTLHFKVERLGNKNPNAKEISLYDKDNILIVKFDTLTKMKQYLKDNSMPPKLLERKNVYTNKYKGRPAFKYVGYYTI